LLLVLGLFFNNSFGQIVANDDNFFAPPSSNFVFNPLNNDTLNGVPVNSSNVLITLSNSVPNIFNSIFISGGNIYCNTGGLPVGNYVVSYQICEIANPSNCDYGYVLIQVSCPIPNPVISLSQVSCTTLTSNVTFSNLPAGSWIIYITGQSSLQGSGSTHTFVGLPVGNYSANVYDNQQCSSDIITFQVNNPFNVLASATGTYVDYNTNGFIDVGDTINYQFSVKNVSSTGCSLTNIGISSSPQNGFLNITGGPIASLANGVTDNTTLTATHVITQTEINAGYVQLNRSVYASNITKDVVLNTSLGISDGLKLNAFIDSNGNGVQEFNEPNFNQGTFGYQINSGVIHNLYSSTGKINLYESNSSNSYNLSYTINQNNSFCGSQYTISSASYNNISVSNGSGITTYNFPINIIVPCNDVSVNIIYSTSARPGFPLYNRIHFVNNGNQTIQSGVLTYTKDSLVSMSSIPQGAIATASGFNYSFSNLLPNESRYLDLNVLVPTIPSVSLGQLLTNSVTITPTDANMPNNSATITQAIVGSYDPNDKTENHGRKILHSSFTSNDYLTYKIQFENTGTAEAINIRVNDVLESKLDETSIRMVASSHPYILDRVGSTLNWKFDGVNLPPSTPTSTTIGHGFIVFQVKPKPGYAVGDIITNIANIYFDFNPAIVTDPCITEFVSTLANQNFTFKNFSFSPNPVTNVLKISNDSAIDAIEVSSLLGQKVMTKSVKDLQTEIDMSQLTNGIYFVKVSAGGNEKTIKIVKQ
jgi:uncharacterized repeat protein (TIGR01451 family)